MKKETGEIVVGGEIFTATMVTLDADLQKKSVTITENTTTTIGPDEEYDGLEEVTVETDVQGGIDPSEANATVDDVVEGKTFYAGNEIKKTGTLQVYQGATTITNNGTLMTQNKVLRSNIEIAVGGTLITKTITQNGVYRASDDGADGYSQVDVTVTSNGNEFDLLLTGNYGYMTEDVCNDIIQGNYIYNGGIN